MKICIITDAWHPQVNGVVRTLDTLIPKLKAAGHKPVIVSPKMFRTLPCPTYPEIRLSVNIPFRLKAILQKLNPDAIHIATEGPLGWAGRRYCKKQGIPFTTAYHTAFPEYIAARSPLPTSMLYPIFRRFHNAGKGVLVSTRTVRDQLKNKGFNNIVPWTRGVDTSQFYPRPGACFDLKGPVQLYVGRVAVEKNIEAFLQTDVPGTKVVVGDGPALDTLKKKHPDTHFMGPLFGDSLAYAYSAADVFVFPSKTDTFGMVMLEALACGTPVAAYPVQGPLDVIGRDGTGPFEHWHTPIASLQDNLSHAIHSALTLDSNACVDFAKNYSWDMVADQFISALKPRYTLNHPIPVHA